MRARALPFVLLLACGQTKTVSPPAPRDAAAADASEVDTGGSPDALAPRDAEPGDPDAGHRADFGPHDAAAPDLGPPDAGVLPDGGPARCAMDDDCAPGGWCRPTPGGAQECAPWAAEGERCGGHTLPWDFERCDPSRACLDVDPRIADLPGVCGRYATVRELETDPATWNGRVVGVMTGYILAGAPACTRIACSPQNPCCNRCTSSQSLADSPRATSGMALLSPQGRTYGCAGTECDWQNHCDEAPGRYRVTGRFRAGPPPLFEVIRLAPLP